MSIHVGRRRSPLAPVVVGATRDGFVYREPFADGPLRPEERQAEAGEPEVLLGKPLIPAPGN